MNVRGYDHLDRDTLIRLLQRRDAERQLGLVWERDEIEADRSLNDDYVSLELDPALSHGDAPWDNLVIEGDNFDALRALRMSHKGAIRCIYIDPPYNTGNRDFVYNDRFVDKTDRYRHSLWLEFMYRRLQLAKELLADDGVIFVSIDDNELFRLGMLMDRVFGEENKIGVVAWKNVTDNNPSRIVTEHEYIVAYARTKAALEPEWKSTDVAKKEAMLAIEAELQNSIKDLAELQRAYTKWFRANKDQLPPLDNYKFIDKGGIYAGSRSVHNPGKEGYRYDVIHPVTGQPCQQPLMGYRFPEETMRELLEAGRILFGETHEKLVELKIYLRDYRSKLSSVIDLDGRSGPNELRRWFDGDKVFNNPKPVELISYLLSFVTGKDDLVLDFFAGSGTTGQAVAELNAEDGGARKYILVGSTEATEDQPDKNDALAGTPFAGLGDAAAATLALHGGAGGAPRPLDQLMEAYAQALPKPFEYLRRADAPATLRGEKLPPVAEDFEAGLAAHVDFSPVVLADRQRNRIQVQRSEVGLFDGGNAVSASTEDVWAGMSAEAVSARAEQIRLRLGEANDRELQRRLLERFERAIVDSGAEPPQDEELLFQQLDLVLARRPQLLREAYKSLRYQSIVDIDVPLPAAIESGQRSQPASRGLYGVFPPGLNPDELAIAQLLDASPLVTWWHRNPSRTGVGLYRWDEGDGYYPDFVVRLAARPAPGIALLEVKGDFLAGKDSEVDKAAATHRDYGRVFMVGRKRGERDFTFLRDLGGKLQAAGAFSVEQLQFP